MSLSTRKQLQPIRHGWRPKRIYLCGPIDKNCWRHEIVPGLREAFCEDDPQRERARHDLTTELPTITPGFVCVGPWFMTCDHGCAHGPGTHGTEGGGCMDDPIGAQHPEDVFQINIQRIRRADAVFAYFDRKEAYGSVFEIGVASTLGKPVFVGFTPNASWHDDMWFCARAGVGDPSGHIGPAATLWTKFCRTVSACS
jgi:hypothetical protein